MVAIIIFLILILSLELLIKKNDIWEKMILYLSISDRILILILILGVINGYKYFIDLSLLIAMVSFIGVLIIAEFASKPSDKNGK
jgi:multisubunit Na+/H+ antiporter MnhF subunit